MGGRFAIAVPTGANDIVCWNAHRIYGPVLYSHLFANYDQLYSEVSDLSKLNTANCHPSSLSHTHQPITVLEKPENI